MRWPAAALAALLLAGCVPVGAAQPGATSAAPSLSAADLDAQRRAAGIADCPASDADVAPVAGGLPDLVLDCLGGSGSVRLAGLRGTPMVINLWAQWCPPCREESPILRAFGGRAEGKVLLLGIDYNDPQPALAIEFAGLVGWKQPQLADPDKVLEGPLKFPGIPMTLLVDAEGRVVHRQVGPFTSLEELVNLVEDELGVTV